MPLPEPKSHETGTDFMQRFMKSKVAKAEYPRQDQRYAVGMNKLVKRNKQRKKYV